MKHIKTTNRPKKQKYSVIIPGDRMGLRMKSFGAKSLIKLSDQSNVISHQLTVINKVLKQTDIVLITGFESKRVTARTPDNITKLYNEDYTQTNISHSVRMGLDSVNTNNVVIIPGNLVFNQSALSTSFNESMVIMDLPDKQGGVGCVSNNNQLEHMIYDIPNKWSQIAYFTGRELELLRDIVSQDKYKMFFMFEIINMIINKGGEFNTILPKNIQITSIDSSKDIKVARKIYENSINVT